MTELRFPRLPLYQGWGRPMRVESNVDSLVLLEGTPPQDLNGVFSAGKLLILKEDDLPYAVDAVTLETLGRFDYDGRVKAQRLSAHAKIDPVADTVLTYGNQARGDGTLDMAFYEFDRDGNIL